MGGEEGARVQVKGAEPDHLVRAKVQMRSNRNPTSLTTSLWLCNQCSKQTILWPDPVLSVEKKIRCYKRIKTEQKSVNLYLKKNHENHIRSFILEDPMIWKKSLIKHTSFSALLTKKKTWNQSNPTLFFILLCALKITRKKKHKDYLSEKFSVKSP